jgi:hypothetical protein
VKDDDVPNSSEKDVILTLAVGQLRNAHPFVRTLRTTGCVARCVLFVDSAVRDGYSAGFFETLESCGVQFVDLGPNPGVQVGRDFLRQLVYHRFVAVNRDYIDRVLVADLFDTVFQKDPFIDSFRRDRVYYSDEGRLIKYDGLNRRWIRQVIIRANVILGLERINDSMREEVFEHTVVNGGLIGGGVGPFLQHLKFMDNIGSFVSLAPFCLDQPLLNVGVGLGLLTFPYQIDPPNSTFLGSLGLVVDSLGRAMGKELGLLRHEGRIHNVLHQYDRSTYLKNVVRKACPGPFSDLPDYIGK